MHGVCWRRSESTGGGTDQALVGGSVFLDRIVSVFTVALRLIRVRRLSVGSRGSLLVEHQPA
jgi:hypothetical protein